MCTFDDDFEVDYDTSCPHCGHEKTHHRECRECEDGLVNRFDEDPLWYDVDECEVCDTCKGKGYEHWCPNCGESVEIQNPYTCSICEDEISEIEWAENNGLCRSCDIAETNAGENFEDEGGEG
jgi:hypothetical protein